MVQEGGRGGSGGAGEGSTVSAGGGGGGAAAAAAAGMMRGDAPGVGRMGDGGVGGGGVSGAGGVSFGGALGVGFGGALGGGGLGNGGGQERGGAAGISRISQLGGHTRQRPQQRKHPEPLRRAVANCLSASYNATASAFTSEAVRTLQDYLANSSTMDSAYIVLLDHALAERDRSPPVITKCVSLLKRYLFRYVPRPATLQQIDAFCGGLIAECQAAGNIAGKRTTPWVPPVNEHGPSSSQGTPPSPSATSLPFASDALVKSLVYVRALVARNLPRLSFHSSNNMPSLAKPLKPALPSPRTRPFTSPYDRGLKRAVPDDREAVKSAAMCISGLEEIDEEDVDYIAVDVMKWRWLGGKGQPSWAPSPVMMDSGGIARPHVERMQNLAEQGASALMLKSIQQKETDAKARPGGRPLNSLEGIAEQILLPSTVTAVTDRLAVRSHLRAVAAAKRYKPHISQRWEGDVPPSTLRRRARPLFQYRHYSEQQPLRLSDAEMEEVISAVCSETSGSSGNTLALVPLPNNQGGKLAPEAADVAASVLIKLLIDMYISDPQTAAPLTLSMLQGMLTSQSASVRIRAFDLTLNLGVHAHLLEPMQSEDQSTPDEVPSSDAPSMENGSFSSFGSLPGGNRTGDRHRMNKINRDTSSERFLEKPERGTPPAVGRFEAWLLDLLCEMLLLLVQTEEADEGVWAAALSCLLYLALKALLEISWEYGWADEVHCRLIRIACNLLYRLPADETLTSKPSLDLDQIEILGGIETICAEFARAKTLEAKRNLFAVLFDFVLYDLEDESTSNQMLFPGTEEIQAVATALCLAEAPECYALAFKQGLPGVGEALSKSITTAMARDVTSGRLNAQLLENVVGALDKLAAAYAHPEDEFMELLPVTMTSEGLNNDSSRTGPAENTLDSTLVAKAWSTLESLLHSSRPCYRCNGYVWLLELLSAEMARGSSKSSKLNTNALQRQLGLLGNLEKPAADDETPESENTEKQKQTPTISSAVRLMCGLLKSKRPSIRRGFVVILERVLLQCQRYGCDLELNLSTVADGEVPKPEGVKSMGPQDRALAMLGLMNGALWQAISANDTDRVNILQMCNMMFSQLCVSWPLASNASNRSLSTSGRVDSSLLDNYGSQRQGGADGMPGIRSTNSPCSVGSRSCSVASMLLNGQAAAPKLLVANMPTALLYWPLMQLAGAATEDVTLGVAVGSRGGGNVPGGACDVRAALLLILIGKCTAYQVALEEVGGEEFFRSLLDDIDARVAYYTSAFLLKRMMTEEPEKYQRMLHNLVFKAQQSNNEKILENPYLQMRGILQLSSECDSPSFQLDS
ncbi:hypothetical protein AXG93_523s1190 [Marchantia polymorpha subsp. ruderalis]|uniref:Uncharacterized protein n=1 Tax=Marchantia polymorpha subsp. ruderalis TaxID=1480154 RepID=A0A176VW34_MARPO|nr:hypothetical protein AXG93_523s1190 [Marchantia polymorpha subsp. ruderalis]